MMLSATISRRLAGPADPRYSLRDAADLGRLMADAIEGMKAVTIAAVRGWCVGGGLVLAAACDLRVAADDARFSIPEVDLGIPLAWGGIPRLVREIGPARTKDLVMTCRPFDAAEAAAAGFLTDVVDPGSLDATVDDLAGSLAAKAPYTLWATKRHVDAVTSAMVGLDRSWGDADSLAFAFRDPDCIEAAVAKLEKELDDVSFRAFSVGIPFLTAGLWMGAFWAQEAWANYWGWDSKENSALITWLIYVIYIHLRMLGGYRGEKAMAMLLGGALSVFATFQLFGYLPDSQKNSLHKYTDDNVVPREGMSGGAEASASAPADAAAPAEDSR